MIMRAAPLCLGCKHFDKAALEEGAAHKCKAFPGGIPEDVWQNAWDHRAAYSSEKYLFEPIDDEAEEYAKLLFS